MGYDDLVPAAIRKGTFLTKPMLEFLHKTLHFKIPEKKKETGAKRRVGIYKEVYAWAAVQHFFDSESDAEKLRMFNGIMNTTGEVVPCPDELLEAINMLDPVHREDFDFVKKMCTEQKKRQEKVKSPDLSQPPESVKPIPVDKETEKLPPNTMARDIVTTEEAGKEHEPRTVQPHVKSEAKLYTPPSLLNLVPGRGHLPHVYIKRLPGPRKQYQGFYPGQCVYENNTTSLIATRFFRISAVQTIERYQQNETLAAGKAGEKQSLNSTWSGPRRMLSEKEALKEVLSFLWNAHHERNPKHKDQNAYLACIVSSNCSEWLHFKPGNNYHHQSSPHCFLVLWLFEDVDSFNAGNIAHR